jgi:ATP-dependent RNA helicase DDX21
VFTQTKADANALILSDKIKQDIEVMHGDIAQNQREVTLKRFKEGKFNVLVATDVASRGLDIPNVDLVIQIEPPQDTETYIHRSGRTARAGNSGTCITFFTKKTQILVQQIEERAGVKLKLIGAPQPEDVIRASSKGILKKLDGVSEDVLELFSEASKLLSDKYKGDKDKAIRACLAYISGHYQMTLVARSMLTGQEKMTTIEMTMPPIEAGKLPRDIDYQEEVLTFLRFGWPPKITDNIRIIKVRKDGTGVLFDLWDDRVETFMDYYQDLSSKGNTKGV